MVSISIRKIPGDDTTLKGSQVYWYSLYSLDIEEDDEIGMFLAPVEDSMFGCYLKLKKLVKKGNKSSMESHSDDVK